MTKREQFLLWLGDAHAMEVGIISTLEKHIADAAGQPRVRAALKKHLAETKRHATEMKRALAALGGSHPVVREGLSKVVNLVAGLGTSFVKDTPVKNAIADFATEHFEIACYTSLELTARDLGETKIAATCRAILAEERAMAKELAALFPAVNAAYLATLADDKKADEPRSPLPAPVVRMKAKASTKAKAPVKPAAKASTRAAKKLPAPKKSAPTGKKTA